MPASSFLAPRRHEAGEQQRNHPVGNHQKIAKYSGGEQENRQGPSPAEPGSSQGEERQERIHRRADVETTADKEEAQGWRGKSEKGNHGHPSGKTRPTAATLTSEEQPDGDGKGACDSRCGVQQRRPKAADEDGDPVEHGVARPIRRGGEIPTLEENPPVGDGLTLEDHGRFVRRARLEVGRREVEKSHEADEARDAAGDKPEDPRSEELPTAQHGHDGTTLSGRDEFSGDVRRGSARRAPR